MATAFMKMLWGYLTAIDPEVAKRTWQTAMDELTKTKTGNTHHQNGSQSRGTE
jgi:hypothetical protein